jgi:hypothetical protein
VKRRTPSMAAHVADREKARTGHGPVTGEVRVLSEI